MEKTASTLLLVGEDKELCNSLSELLEKENIVVENARNEKEMDIFIEERVPDIILLDINLPKISGLDVCKRLRKNFSIPIIMLSGSESDIDKVLALELGANNYLTKPIHPRVLLAFIKSSLEQKKRYKNKEVDIAAEHEILYFSRFELNCSNHILSKDGAMVTTMPPSEYGVLYVLAQNPKRVLSRDRILNLTNDTKDSYDRSIDTLISRIRKKIEDNPKNPIILKTIRGSGYMLDISVKKKIVSGI